MLIFQDGIIFDDPLKDYYKTYMSLIAVLTIIINLQQIMRILRLMSIKFNM